MSPPPAPVSEVPRPGVQNTLFKLSEELNEKDLPVDGQQQSLLIQLPQEVRTIIWQYALGGNKIEFEEHGYIVSTRRLLGYPFRRFGYEWRTIIQEDDGVSHVSRGLNVRHGTSLLKTCRLILGEAVDSLCDSNRFILSEASFWAASNKIIHHHFAQLRILDFHKSFHRDDRKTWTQLCKTIAGMANLRNLKMRLHKISTRHDDDRKKYQGGGLRYSSQKVFSITVTEEFILDLLYQIEQVKEFVVELDDRWGDAQMPKVQPDAPFKLICEFGEDRIARRDKEEKEERERRMIEKQKAAEEHRLRKARREAERVKRELERKAQEIVESYQPFSGQNPFLDEADC